MNLRDLAQHVNQRGLVADYTDAPSPRVVGGRRRVEARPGLFVLEQSFIVYPTRDGWQMVATRVGAPDVEMILANLDAMLEALLLEYGITDRT